jgi:hypothetical protein
MIGLVADGLVAEGAWLVVDIDLLVVQRHQVDVVLDLCRQFFWFLTDNHLYKFIKIDLILQKKKCSYE